ncbi:MAG TPA: glycosyltransferase [Candidatus Acidoferrales bacterium]|jgi:glycosyltransferase involved in cell wall biosynthesis|nr:glycosyltransferase [Candidatus Acidoferrales bacterium]
MRILHLIMSASSADGGPIEGVRQLGATLTAGGEHQVEVATLDDPKAPFLTDFPLPVHALGPRHTWYGYAPRVVPWLRANAPRFDVVVVNGLWRYSSFAAWRALHGTATPYVVFTHGMLDPWFKREYPLKHLKKWLYWPWADYRVLRDAAAVVFTCEEERLLARQSFSLYSAREVVVGYGTSLPPSPDEAEVKSFFSEFPHLQGKRLALFMGRLHPKKGCDLAIGAFAQVLAADPEWHLVIAGPDQAGLRPSLSSLAAKLQVSDRITWTGMIGGATKRSALSTAEVFVLPSHQENFGIVVAEAMSYGVPPLISDKVNIWREIRDDGAGIVATDDLAGTCSLLTSWISQSDHDKKLMRARARQSFASRFEIHAAADSLVHALKAIT